MARSVSDSDSVRRLNRGLVIGALRVHGPLSRTALATQTGLSHASITAITQDLIAQDIIVELNSRRQSRCQDPRPPGAAGRLQPRHRLRGAVRNRRQSRPPVAGRLWRHAGRPHRDAADAGHLRRPPRPAISCASASSSSAPAIPRRPQRLRRIAISVQGILDREGTGLKWSPIPHLAGTPFARLLSDALGLPVALHKRGRLLAEGARWLDPQPARRQRRHRLCRLDRRHGHDLSRPDPGAQRRRGHRIRPYEPQPQWRALPLRHARLHRGLCRRLWRVARRLFGARNRHTRRRRAAAGI